MPVARFEMPDGRVARFEVPDGTTPEQAQAMIAQSLEGGQIPSGGRDKFDLRGEGYDRMTNYSPRDTIAGQVRGAGSIGATLMAPFDYLEDKLTNLVAGPQSGPSRNEQRRADMTGGLQSLGADPTSSQFQANKLLGEIAGTSGIGPAAAAALSRIPGAATQIPSLLNAIRTGGMTTGAPAGASRIADMGVRIAGGAVNGGLTAGAVNPEDAGTGMMIGGAFPVAAKTLGAAGDVVGSAFRGGPAANPTMLQTAKESMNAGYVIPPSMLEPSLKNRVLESTSGKLATQQLFSNKNQSVSEDLMRKALGLPPDAPLTRDTMIGLRKQAGQAYDSIRGAGTVATDSAFDSAIAGIATKYKTTVPSFPGLGKTNMHGGQVDEVGDIVKALKASKQFDASEAVDAVALLRESADKAFISGDKTLGKAGRAAAASLEDLLGRHLQAQGSPDALAAFQQARKTIAKSYTAEKAIREGSGTLDARVLARRLQANKPLEGEMLTIAKFANTFDKAAQPPHLIGSPGVHNLTSMFSTGAGATGAAAGAAIGGPGGAAVGATLGAAYPYVVPPIVRARMMSQGFQRGLLDQGGGSLLTGSMDELLPLMYRSNGLLAARPGQ